MSLKGYHKIDFRFIEVGGERKLECVRIHRNDEVDALRESIEFNDMSELDSLIIGLLKLRLGNKGVFL